MKLQNPRLKELFKTPKRKTYTLVGATVLTVGIFVLFSLRPTFVKIADLNREIKDKQEFLDKLEDKLEAINYLISQKRSVEQELSYFEEDFPSEEKSGFVVANLAAIAEKFDLRLISVEFEEDEIDSEENLDIGNAEDVGIMQVDARLEGNTSGMEDYIEYLESFPRIFDVKSISYANADLSSFEGELEEFSPVECSTRMYLFYWNKSADSNDSS